MYADLQFTNNSTGNKWKGKTKVYKYKANDLVFGDCDFIVGFCGNASEMCTVATYFEHPDMFNKPPRINNLQGLVLTADKRIFIFDHYTNWLIMDEPFAAIGTGSEKAIGAMAFGATPKEAVRIAAKHDAFTGMGIKGYRF